MLQCASVNEDHPRMRGEDRHALFHTLKMLGSPPHARGRLSGRSSIWSRNRITPACAGKTRSAIHLTIRAAGSPPHARGRLVRRSTFECKTRITPACAGKTFQLESPRECLEDHPRMRGEDMAVDAELNTGKGSPPHARGRRQRQMRPLWRTGITPACAGKTQCD